MKRFLTLPVVALLLGLPVTAPAAELGMDAPPLDVAKFVKGGPVELAKGKGDQIYVVEFWATWCGPCRVSIPHLTELQAKLKDKNVTIIGVSDEDVETVESYVAKMGEKMDYVVAVDNDRSTFARYMQAFNQNGIPTAFVIDRQGKIAWYGHPMGGLDQVLDQVLAGTFDVKKHLQAQRIQQEVYGYLDETVKDTYSEDAKKKGFSIVERCENAEVLNEMSWIILTHRAVKHRDLELAAAAAKKAYGLTDGKNASVTDTYARALYDSGKKAEAVKLQEEAVDAAEEGSMKQQLQETLRRYQAGE